MPIMHFLIISAYVHLQLASLALFILCNSISKRLNGLSNNTCVQEGGGNLQNQSLKSLIMVKKNRFSVLVDVSFHYGSC